MERIIWMVMYTADWTENGYSFYIAKGKRGMKNWTNFLIRDSKWNLQSLENPFSKVLHVFSEFTEHTLIYVNGKKYSILLSFFVYVMRNSSIQGLKWRQWNESIAVSQALWCFHFNVDQGVVLNLIHFTAKFTGENWSVCHMGIIKQF